MQGDTVLKICPLCKAIFTADDLLYNESIELLGMTVPDPENGEALFFFQHETDRCGTSFAIPVGELSDWITEHMPETLHYGKEGCMGYCNDLRERRICHNDCSNAPFRRLMNLLIKHKTCIRNQSSGA